VSSLLEELLKKRRKIGMHCILATAVLDFIKLRRLGVFCELEEKIMPGNTLDT